MGILNITRQFLSFSKEQYLDRDSLEHLQEKRLAELVARARKTEHFGRAMPSGSPDISEIPLTSKEMMRSRPDSFLPKGTSRKGLYEVRTSGSTGTPLSIFIDQDAEDRRIAKEYFVECALGRSPFEGFAHITTIPYVTHRLLSATGLFPKIVLSPYVEEERNLEAIRKSRIRMLRAFPSTLNILAKLNLKDPIKLRSIISTGETMDSRNRKLIEDSFGCPVLESYGSMEFRTVAFQCPEEKKFHVCSSSLIMEILDEQGRPVKGGAGEVVVTSFHNSPMQFLRYRTGDIARWGGDCTCGRGYPVIRSIDGRKADVFVLPSGRIRPFGAFVIALNQVRVRSFQVVQESAGLFVFRYVPLDSPGLSGEEMDEIGQRIRVACLNEEVDIEFESVDSISRGGRGKHRYMVSKVARP